MRNIKSFFIAFIIVLILPSMVFAENTEPLQPTGSNLNLTVVVPSEKEKVKVYPVSIYESSDNGINQIIKTYELSDSEKPEDIPRDGFQRGDLYYELSDVIKKENTSSDVKEHTKTVTLNTNTKELNAIIKQLASTVEYKSDDGYAGILNLDVNSIKVETAGTKKSSYTISSVREYPNLSSNDTALVPKTITDNGKTMTLAGVEWRTQTSSSVDYQELPATYTAIANYTATGSKTVVTGYTVTANYKGSISKAITGKTIYTAIFNGSEITTETAEETTEQEILSTLSENISEKNIINFSTVKGGGIRKKLNTAVILIIIFSVMGGAACCTFLILLKKRKNKKAAADEKENSSADENNEEGGTNV